MNSRNCLLDFLQVIVDAQKVILWDVGTPYLIFTSEQQERQRL
jgi:hypothetical protein